LRAQPISHFLRVEANAGSHAERRNATFLGMLENGYVRDGQDLFKVVGGEGVTSLLDLICKGFWQCGTLPAALVAAIELCPKLFELERGDGPFNA